MGGVSDHLSLEAAGATVIPFGAGDSQLLVRTILDLKVGVIHCTPSYPAALERTIAEHFPGLAPHDLGLRLGLFGGEAGLDNPSFRKRMESVWGFTARNANYGVSDVFSNFASQCWANSDLHFLGEDVLYPELVEPESGEPVPWREGARGELVLTHLKREAQPLVRFRTNDVIVITGTGMCTCGRWAPRFRVLGRSDDMVVVRGVNIFPTAVGGVIGGFDALSGEFRIRLKGSGPYDRLPVEAEMAEGAEASGALAARVEEAIKATLRASASATLVPSGLAAAHRRQDATADPGELTMAGTVLTDVADGVATLSLNRPGAAQCAERRAACRSLGGARCGACRRRRGRAGPARRGARLLLRRRPQGDRGPDRRRTGDPGLHRGDSGSLAPAGAGRQGRGRRDPRLGRGRRAGVGDQLRPRGLRRGHQVLLPEIKWGCSRPAA